jgi:hypothetical protein
MKLGARWSTLILIIMLWGGHCPGLHDGMQWASMGSDVWKWSNINTAKNGARGQLAEEPQAP